MSHVIIEEAEDFEMTRSEEGGDHGFGMAACTQDPDSLHGFIPVEPWNGVMVSVPPPETPSRRNTLTTVTTRILKSSQ